MVASGVAQRFDQFILTCLCIFLWCATIGRIPLGEWSARRRDFYLTTQHSQQTNRQISMPRVGFEPTISAGERPKTYALDRAVTGIGYGVSGGIAQLFLNLGTRRGCVVSITPRPPLPPGKTRSKPSQSSNWGRRLARSASRRPPVC